MLPAEDSSLPRLTAATRKYPEVLRISENQFPTMYWRLTTFVSKATRSNAIPHVLYLSDIAPNSRLTIDIWPHSFGLVSAEHW